MEDENVGFNVTMRASPLSGKTRGDRGRLADVLSEVGLVGREDEQASHLSGGEKQRLAVARAIYRKARIIYVDEPTASLDHENRSAVIRLFQERAETGCTVLIATHDKEMIDCCTTSYLVDRRAAAGLTVGESSPGRVLRCSGRADPQLRTARQQAERI